MGAGRSFPPQDLSEITAMLDPIPSLSCFSCSLISSKSNFEIDHLCMKPPLMAPSGKPELRSFPSLASDLFRVPSHVFLEHLDVSLSCGYALACFAEAPARPHVPKGRDLT